MKDRLIFVGPERSSGYGKRGAAKQAEKNRHSVEGQLVTSQEIADRIGTTRSLACKRLCRERKKPGPVTWVGLARTDSGR
jgi:hypothetical protein